MDPNSNSTVAPGDSNLVFCCYHCGVGVVLNSREHDECVTNDGGETWYCVACSDYCVSDDSDDDA